MEKYVECKNKDGLTLRGMLHIPDMVPEKKKVPMVIIFHGFLADRNESVFCHVELSRRLCEMGIASVRFDFSGSGESDGETGKFSLLTEVNDGCAILEFVKNLEFVDNSKIAVHGMSQGGAVAGLVASEHEKEIACASLWAPAINCIDGCKDRTIIDGIRLDNIEKDGYVNVRGMRLDLLYYTDTITINYYEKVKKYHRPMQVVHGDSDTCVPIDYSRRLQGILGDTCALIEIPGANHDFGKIEYNQKRIQYACDFLKKNLCERNQSF